MARTAARPNSSLGSIAYVVAAPKPPRDCVTTTEPTMPFGQLYERSGEQSPRCIEPTRVGCKTRPGSSAVHVAVHKIPATTAIMAIGVRAFGRNGCQLGSTAGHLLHLTVRPPASPSPAVFFLRDSDGRPGCAARCATDCTRIAPATRLQQSGVAARMSIHPGSRSQTTGQ